MESTSQYDDVEMVTTTVMTRVEGVEGQCVVTATIVASSAHSSSNDHDEQVGRVMTALSATALHLPNRGNLSSRPCPCMLDTGVSDVVTTTSTASE